MKIHWKNVLLNASIVVPFFRGVVDQVKKVIKFYKQRKLAEKKLGAFK